MVLATLIFPFVLSTALLPMTTRDSRVADRYDTDTDSPNMSCPELPACFCWAGSLESILS